MRKNAAFVARAALVAGLLLVTGIGGASRARAAVEQQPWLGVYLQELTPDLREGMDYRGDGGVIVSRVVTGGPAERAGLRNGDVIVRVNSRTVNTPAGLQNVIRTARVGQSISVEIFRDGERRYLSARLEARPSDEEGAGGTIESPEEPEAPEAPEAPVPPEPPGRELGRRRVIIRDLGGMHDLQGLEELKGLDLPNGMMGLAAASRGRLGVRIESLSPVLGEYFGLPDGKGALVLEVLKGTPAERAGLKPGDVITRAGDQAVTNGTDLVNVLRGKEGKVALRVVRHGTPRTVEAELEKDANTGYRLFDERLGGRPGVQKRIIQRTTDREDLRHELDQLRQQLDELRQRLDAKQGKDGGE